MSTDEQTVITAPMITLRNWLLLEEGGTGAGPCEYPPDEGCEGGGTGVLEAKRESAMRCVLVPLRYRFGKKEHLFYFISAMVASNRSDVLRSAITDNGLD